MFSLDQSIIWKLNKWACIDLDLFAKDYFDISRWVKNQTTWLITDENAQRKIIFKKVYFSTILSSVTDKKWNSLNVDFKTIWVAFFLKCNFWKWTRFWEITGKELLKKNLWINSISLKSILQMWWIERPDLPEANIDYKSPNDIKEIFKRVTDKSWVPLNIDFLNIWVGSFSKLWFWYWTKFWLVSWNTLLNQYWGANKLALFKLLKNANIIRDELPNEKIDFNNPSHIREIFKTITNIDWKKIKVNFNSIWVAKFVKLHFWKWTVYWEFSGFTILEKLGWVNLKTLKKVLKIVWISRPELPEEDVNFNDQHHFKELFSIITDKTWNVLNVNLYSINITDFSSLYFWRWTRFWQIKWELIIKSFISENSQIKRWKNSWKFKKILSLSWIERNDL